MNTLQIGFWSEGDDGIDANVHTDVIPRKGETVFWEGTRYTVGEVSYEYRFLERVASTLVNVELIAEQEPLDLNPPTTQGSAK